MLIKGSGACGDDDDDDDDNDDSSMSVGISSFGIKGLDSSARVQWRVSGSEPYAGWNLYRAQSPGTQYEAINPEIIPGGLSAYDYMNTGLENLQEYCYVLEVVELSGKTTSFGPKCVTPQSDSEPVHQDQSVDEDGFGDESEDRNAASGCAF